MGGMGVDMPHSQTSTLEQSFSDQHIVFSQIDFVTLIQWRLHLCLNIQHFLHTTTTISNVQNCQFSIDLDAEAEHQQLNSQTMQNYSQQQCSYCISNPIQSKFRWIRWWLWSKRWSQSFICSTAFPSPPQPNPRSHTHPSQLICHLLSADCNPSSQVMIRCQMSDPTQCYSCVWVIVSNSDESGGLSWIPTWI